MTLRTRSSVRRAFLALLFQIRQCRRSTSGTITAFACIRLGVSVDNPLAVCFACCSRMAMWNQSAIGGFLQPASARIDRRPGAPSVNAVNSVSAVRPTVSRLRREHHGDLRLRLRHGAAYWSAAAAGLDVPDPNLQMPLALVTAADECRIDCDGDRRYGRARLRRGGVA
jgi:hypothetical protein